MVSLPKVYLAGPEVFLPNAVEYAHWQVALCRQYGFIGLHPMDNNIAIVDKSLATAMKIYRGDVCQIKECDIVVANCNQFRGGLMDDGTAYELGYGNALGKPSYGYIEDALSYNERIRKYEEGHGGVSPGIDRDQNGYILTEDFTLINPMMQCGMSAHGGRLIVGSFEDCLKAIRHDVDCGSLFPPFK